MNSYATIQAALITEVSNENNMQISNVEGDIEYQPQEASQSTSLGYKDPLQVNIDKIDCHDLIGQGGFGEVYNARYEGRSYAVKFFGHNLQGYRHGENGKRSSIYRGCYLTLGTVLVSIDNIISCPLSSNRRLKSPSM